MTDKKYWLLTEFQSTLPQRERPCLRFFQPGQLQFQSTLPQRERRKESNIHQSNSYFNPRSRKGSDSRTGGHVRQILNFNPRSRKGSDQLSSDSSRFLYWFQSTLPQRERLIPIISKVLPYIFQSTLPQRERRFGQRLCRLLFAHFNPRSRKGSDYNVYWLDEWSV